MGVANASGFVIRPESHETIPVLYSTKSANPTTGQLAIAAATNSAVTLGEAGLYEIQVFGSSGSAGTFSRIDLNIGASANGDELYSFFYEATKITVILIEVKEDASSLNIYNPSGSLTIEVIVNEIGR